MQMSHFRDTYCQLSERFISKEEWNNYLYSCRQLHREVHGFWPAYFPQRKLTKDENIILAKAFWKMFSATINIKEVEKF